MAKQGVQNPSNNSQFERVRNKDRPDEAFTTDRAVRAGRANAASGRIMVTVPNDHFGPIPPEADPRGLVSMIGESLHIVALLAGLGFLLLSIALVSFAQDVCTAYVRARHQLTPAPTWS